MIWKNIAISTVLNMIASAMIPEDIHIGTANFAGLNLLVVFPAVVSLKQLGLGQDSDIRFRNQTMLLDELYQL